MEINQETSDFIREHLHEDVRKLAFQAKKYPYIDFPFVLKQIEGRQMAAFKLPSWYKKNEIIYPSHLSLEQCSSEHTAAYKASLCKGNSFVDLTGGFGVDTSFFASFFRYVVYVERNSDLCEIAKANFQTLSLANITVCCADAEKYLSEMPPVDCIFLDPARRDKNGKKTVALSDCDPDVSALKDLLLQKGKAIWMKFSPMLDISLAIRQLPDTTEIHVVAVENECKELLFKMEKRVEDKEPVIVCVNLRKDKRKEQFSFTQREEIKSGCSFSDHPDLYLYEPNVSILKAGAYKILTERYHLYKLHPNSHLYTSDVFLPDFPGRIFQVVETYSMNKKELCRVVSDIKQANVSVRNFPLSVNELRKKTGLKDGGDCYIFATTLNDNAKVLIRCEKISGNISMKQNGGII